MRSRYWLRFESGERSGEEVPIPSKGFTVGRRPPEGGLTLNDPSVSGRHARLLVEEEGVRILDLGSTNGTRVDGEVVEEFLATPNSLIGFGKVRLRLGDGSEASAEPADAGAADESDDEIVLEDFDAPAPTPVPARAVDGTFPPPRQVAESPEQQPSSSRSVDEAEGSLEAVSLERLERVGSSSTWGKLAGVAVLALLAAAAYLGWHSFLRSDSGTGTVELPVTVVPGDWIDNGSFESEAAVWEADPEAPVGFYRDSAWRVSGAHGYGVDLLEGEWAVSRSPVFKASPGEEVTLSAGLSVSGAAWGRVGLEVFQSGAEEASITAWAPLVSLSSNGAEAELDPFRFDAYVPPGFDAGRVVAAAFAPDGGTGGFSLDDVHLVPAGPGSAPSRSFGDYRFDHYGDNGLLSRVDRILLSGVRFARRDAAGAGGLPELVAATGASGFRVAESERGLRLSPELPGATTFLARAGAELVDAGLATTGVGGYRGQSRELNLDGARSLLLGAGVGLVRLVFPSDVPLRGRPNAAGGVDVRVELPAGAEIEVQLSFIEDRGEAKHLAERAREAERAGAEGESLTHWSQILEQYPFEAALLREAEEARARLLAGASLEVAAIRRELERAQFFELSGLFEECAAKAAEIAQRYGAAEVSQSALELAAQADAGRAVLEARGVDREARAFDAILEVLSESEAPRLAEHVRRERASVAAGSSTGEEESEGR